MATVSIIIPAYRIDKFLYRSIDSVLQQTHNDIELVIAYENCNKQINDIVRKYDDNRIKTIGCVYMSESIVQAIEYSLGEYLTIFHAGDVMHSEKLRIQLKRMSNNPDVIVCGTWMRPLSNDMVNMYVSGCEGYVKNPILSLLNGNFVHRSTALVRRSFMQKHGILFGCQYRQCAEYGLWFDIFRCGGIMYMEPQCLVYTDTQGTRKTDLDITEEIEESIELRHSILQHLLEKIESRKKEVLMDLFSSFDRAEKAGVVSSKMSLDVFCAILTRQIK